MMTIELVSWPKLGHDPPNFFTGEIPMKKSNRENKNVYLVVGVVVVGKKVHLSLP